MMYTRRCATESMLETIVSIVIFSSLVTSIKLYPSPGALSANIPAPCRASLSTDITCGPRFVQPGDITREVPFNSTFLGEYCSSTCSSSFNSFTANVGTRCGTAKYNFGFNVIASGSDMVAPLQWARDMVCITGSSASDYCIPKILNRTVGICDDCSLKYFAGLLSNMVGIGKMSEKAFSSIISSCKVSPTQFPHTTISRPVSPTVTSSPNTTCIGGTRYTVRQGDTCESIAKENSLAIDSFLYLNNIDFGCKTLTVGNSVCIRDACKTFTIPSNQTCSSISRRLGFTRMELVAWNPILDSTCDNLDILKGRTICITPPGTTTYTFKPTATWSDSWTWPDGSWVPGPTTGTPLQNTTELQWTIPTETLTEITSPAPSLADFFKWCPITGKMYDDGFSWDLLSDGCFTLLDKYCNPVITGTPLPSTSFPSSCFPPYPEPTEFE